MGCGRNLEQTPGLIDPDPADDVGRMRAGIGIRSGAVGTDRLTSAVSRLSRSPSSRSTSRTQPQAVTGRSDNWRVCTLLTPVSVLLPPSRLESKVICGKPFQGVEEPRTRTYRKVKPANWMKRYSTAT